MNPHLTDFGHGIHAIDSGFGRPLLDAVHVIAHAGRAALVDTAVNASVPRVLAALADLGLARDAVDYVILTHVHLDHAGDTFGFIFRELDARGRRHVFPTLTPSQLEPEELHRSIDRIMSYGPQAVHATHYGQATDTKRLAADLHRLIEAQVAVALQAKEAGAARKRLIMDGIARIVEEEAIRQGWPLQGQAALDFFAADIELNAQGLEVWLDGL